MLFQTIPFFVFFAFDLTPAVARRSLLLRQLLEGQALALATI